MKNIKGLELFIALILYIFINIYFSVNEAVIFSNIINPLFWSIIICILILSLKRNYIRRVESKRNLSYMCIFLFTGIIIYYLVGFIYGFSKNPYSMNLLKIFKNIAIQIIPVIGIELVRYVLVSKNKDKKKVLALITIVVILLKIDYKNLIYLLSDKEVFFKYVCSTIIAIIASNILCTYLTKEKSWKLSLMYMISEKLAFLIFPILPNINWFIEGTGKIIFNTIIYVFFKYDSRIKKNDIEKRKKHKFEKLDFVVSIVISILLVCFMLGAFKYEAIAIASNSMNPAFSRGDVVIFKKLSEEEKENLPLGSIIIFTQENKNIAHRIVEKNENLGKTFFITKGDNNNAKDIQEVKLDQIKGIYIFHIKYIGLPSIWLNDFLNN